MFLDGDCCKLLVVSSLRHDNRTLANNQIQQL